ncbi:glucose-1-phosphate adenylyltransferase subunit GlgD [Facklamia languida]
MVNSKLCAILNLTADSSELYPLTYNRPIAALPFASRYRIVDFALSSLTYADVDSVAMFISESGRSIYDHVRSGRSWKLNSLVNGGIFTYSQQNWKARHHHEHPFEDYYYNHRIFLERSKAQYVLVAGTKIIANVDLNAFKADHIDSGKDISLVYKNVPGDRVGENHPNERILKFDAHHQLVDLIENSDKPDYELVPASLNMFILSVDLMLEIIQKALERQQFMELDDLVQFYLLDYSLHTHEYTGYAANIRDIPSYYRANMEMLNHQSFASLFHTHQPVLTKTKNGVPTYYHERSYVRNAIVATGTTICGEVIDSLINRRVYIAENASVRNAIILQGVQIGEGAQVEYAILDKNVVVEPGAVIVGRPDQVVVVAKNQRVDASSSPV